MADFYSFVTKQVKCFSKHILSIVDIVDLINLVCEHVYCFSTLYNIFKYTLQNWRNLKKIYFIKKLFAISHTA